MWPTIHGRALQTQTHTSSSAAIARQPSLHYPASLNHLCCLDQHCPRSKPCLGTSIVPLQALSPKSVLSFNQYCLRTSLSPSQHYLCTKQLMSPEPVSPVWSPAPKPVSLVLSSQHVVESKYGEGTHEMMDRCQTLAHTHTHSVHHILSLSLTHTHILTCTHTRTYHQPYSRTATPPPTLARHEWGPPPTNMHCTRWDCYSTPTPLAHNATHTFRPEEEMGEVIRAWWGEQVCW